MFLGIILIISGILIAIYPQLLALIVSFLLIFTGVGIIFIRYHLKKISREWQNPFIEFFTRF